MTPLLHSGDTDEVVPVERHPGAESRSPGRLLAITISFVTSVALRLETMNQLTKKAQGYFLHTYVRKFAHSLDFGRVTVLILHGGLQGSLRKVLVIRPLRAFFVVLSPYGATLLFCSKL